jgi:hypothetical protein
MRKEFKLAKGWAVFIYIMAPLLIAVFGYFLLMPILPGGNEDRFMQLYWFMAPLSLLMIALFIIGLLDAAKARFVIDSDRVLAKGVFTDRELLFHQIAGYRTDDKYIYILPLEKSFKRIKISRYFGGTAEILNWLSENYPDLDEQKALSEKEEILSNYELVYTPEQREEKLAAARKRSKALNWAGGLIAVWIIFFPEPYEAAVFATLVVPIVSIMVSKYSGGLIRLREEKASAYPSVFSGLFFPALAICIRALMDFNIFQYGNAWKGALLVAAGLMTLILIRSKEFLFRSAKDYGVVFFFGVLSLAYGYGAVVTINCTWDTTTPTVYQAQVTGKHVSSGKSTTYYVTLTPWGPQTKTDDVAVSKGMYNRLQNGNDVRVYFRKGLFSIPWFFIAP